MEEETIIVNVAIIEMLRKFFRHFFLFIHKGLCDSFRICM